MSIGPIVSSAHLAEDSLVELSALEYGLIVSSHAFHRWMVRAMAAADYPDLSALDVLVLHTVRHRGRPKTLADVCLVLGIEETHTVTYAIKKLTRAGLVAGGKRGKEKTVWVTEAGEEACTKYREIRERLLVAGVADLGIEPELLERLAGLLRLMSGQYDQASRAAATL